MKRILLFVIFTSFAYAADQNTSPSSDPAKKSLLTAALRNSKSVSPTQQLKESNSPAQEGQKDKEKSRKEKTDTVAPQVKEKPAREAIKVAETNVKRFFPRDAAYVVETRVNDKKCADVKQPKCKIIEAYHKEAEELGMMFSMEL